MTLSSRSFWRHAAIYATLITVASLLTWGIVAAVGNDPYNRKTSIVSWVPTIYLVALGLLVYRRRTDTEMPFPYGFALGVVTAGLGAAGSALALWSFGTIAGRPLLDRHIKQMLRMLEAAKPRLLTLTDGAKYYQMNYAQTQRMTVGDLVVDDLLGRLFVGFVAALLFAILFRKADPFGNEPERAKRPTE